MNLTLRMATMLDAEVIPKINLRSIFELYTAAYDPAELRRWVGERTAENFRKSIEHGQIYIAERVGNPIGFIDVIPGEVLAVYVMPGSERQGVGSFLLDAAVEKAGISEQRVIVATSHNAVPFYGKRGFRVVKEVVNSRNGVDLALTEMTLSRLRR